jgi:hypothetical protein
MAKWSVMGQHKGVLYSIKFIQDGESVSQLLFDKEAAAAFHGGQAGDYEDLQGQKWYFVFQEFTSYKLILSELNNYLQVKKVTLRPPMSLMQLVL